MNKRQGVKGLAIMISWRSWKKSYGKVEGSFCKSPKKSLLRCCVHVQPQTVMRTFFFRYIYKYLLALVLSHFSLSLIHFAKKRFFYYFEQCRLQLLPITRYHHTHAIHRLSISQNEIVTVLPLSKYDTRSLMVMQSA